jgi:hypothetical protein
MPSKSGSSVISGIVLFFALVATNQTAHAQDCDRFPRTPGCPGAPPVAPNTNATNVGLLDVTEPKKKKTLDPNRTYLLTVDCQSKGTLPTQTIDGFRRQNITAIHMFAITDVNSNVFPTVDKAKALITVYAVGGDTSNRTSYVNKACSTSFFLNPRKPLYLILNSSKVATNEAGTGLKFLAAGIGLISSVWPLFTGLPVPDDPSKRFGAVKDGESALDQLFAILNRGGTPSESDLLYEGDYTIKADYSTVKLNVSPLISIVGLGNATFTAQYQDALGQAFKGSLKPETTADAAEGICLGLGFQMTNTMGFSSLDTAYALWFLASSAGLTAEPIIRCLGKEYASTAVQFAKLDSNPSRKFDDDTVKTVLQGQLTIPQPPFSLPVKTKLQNAMGGLRVYAVKDSPNSDDATALGNFLAPSLLAVDTSTTLVKPAGSTIVPTSLGDGFTIANTDFVRQLREKGFRRFGCLYHDNTSLAMFVAIPEAPPTGRTTYQVTDAISIRLWIDSSQKISRVLLSFDPVDITTAVKANTNACGKGTAVFTLAGS